jgi:hypothetical protein
VGRILHAYSAPRDYQEHRGLLGGGWLLVRRRPGSIQV